jgi:uncharacterized protein
VISLLAGLLALLQIGRIQLPAPVGLVNDFAHVLPPDAVPRMERIAQDVRAKSRGEMAIVTLPDLQGRDKQQVGVQIIRDWKVGKAGNPGDPTRNAGAVILLVPKETSKDGLGHCWVATGLGTEGFITDADAGDICREATPFFQQRDYAGGLELVTLRVAQRFAQEYRFALDTTFAAPQPQFVAPRPTGRGRRSGGIPPVFFFIIFLIILSLFGRGRRGCLPIFLPFGGWGGGGGGGWGGGGGFGGGGGGFGGFGGGGGTSGGGGGSDW